MCNDNGIVIKSVDFVLLSFNLVSEFVEDRMQMMIFQVPGQPVDTLATRASFWFQGRVTHNQLAAYHWRLVHENLALIAGRAGPDVQWESLYRLEPDTGAFQVWLIWQSVRQPVPRRE